MMEEPFWRAGRLISPKPSRGPEDMSRRSLHILDRLTAQVFSREEARTKASRFWVPSTRSSAWVSSRPVMEARVGTMPLTYSGSALMQVPMAVPPMFRTDSSLMA